MRGAHPFLHPEYVALWSEALGRLTTAKVVTAWDGGDLIGYAPLMEGADRFGPLAVPTLRFIGNNVGHPGDVLYADIMAAEPRSAVIRTILYHVRDAWTVKKWDLGYLHPSSPTWRVATDVLRLGERDNPSPQFHPYITLELPEDWSTYLRNLSSNIRQNYRRRLRRLEELGDLRLRVERDPEASSRRVTELTDNHMKWWRGSPKEGWFGEAPVRRFLVSAASLLATQKRYVAFTLELEGSPIAWNVGALAAGRYFEQLISYDQTYASYSPGTILSIMILEHLHSQDVRRVELGPGQDTRKRSLGGVATEYLRFVRFLGWRGKVIELKEAWSRGVTSR